MPYVPAGVLPTGRSLVPGCGRGYDAIAFGKSGYDSLGLDLSPTGVEQAKALLAEQTEQLSGKVTRNVYRYRGTWYTVDMKYSEVGGRARASVFPWTTPLPSQTEFMYEYSVYTSCIVQRKA